jgi:dipeptidase
MEIIGKGEFELGAVWVARRIPKGHVTAHANQARITTFPMDDPDNVLYSPDVVSFAKEHGFYPKDGADKDFSFSDVYNPVTFEGARFCDARVWSFFGDIMGKDWANQYLDYAQGYNLTNRMPLWVQPPNKISLDEMFQHMRNHYEGTPLDMTGNSFSDVGAAFGYMAQRAHPLTWYATDPQDASKQAEYLHERPIATPQTGWNFVGQARSWMPRELSGLLWFGVDDSSTTAHFPIYGSATGVPASYAGQGPQDGVTPPVMTFNMNSAFTVFNLVANCKYYFCLRAALFVLYIANIVLSLDVTLRRGLQPLGRYLPRSQVQDRVRGG